MLINIETERIRRQVSKITLAAQLGVTTKTLYNWINEEVDIPSNKLCKLANYFGVSMEYLLGEELHVVIGRKEYSEIQVLTIENELIVSITEKDIIEKKGYLVVCIPKT